MKANNFSSKAKKILIYVFSILMWGIIWQIVSTSVNKEIFLPAPIKVFNILFTELIPSKQFWLIVGNSLSHIGLGFIIGACTGTMSAIISYYCKPIKVMLWLPIKITKSVPVASFVILSLLWIDSEDLSILIPAVIVFPILYINTLTGMEHVDDKLLDMAKIYNISFIKKFAYIFLPNILPYILSACSLAIGISWKSGIAAEIIGLARNSIGNELYKTKIYLMTPELFAWTIVIILLSAICELVIGFIAKLVKNRYQ